LIAIFDYGSGNIRSAAQAFAQHDISVTVSSDPKELTQAAAMVIPGVGAFGSCMDLFTRGDGIKIVQERLAQGKPTFGICVGAQIFFESGSEKGDHKGMGIIKGSVDKLNHPKLPQIGWNQVSADPTSKIFSGIKSEYFYFVHSYGVARSNYEKNNPTDPITAWSNYGGEFLAAYESPLITITQFHPEKSGEAGLKLISNWIKNYANI
jgi:imidazole glycerol-phosphate synthase subunit HisH